MSAAATTPTAASAPAAGGAAATAAPAADAAGSSGVVTVAPELADAFKALKQRRKFKFLHISLTADFKAVVAKEGPPTASAKDFIKSLPSTDARYAVYDFEETLRDGRKKSKIYFVLWTPTAAPARAKMFYSSQRRALDAAFAGVEDVQISKPEDLAKLLGEKSLTVDEDEEGDWDPDA